MIPISLSQKLPRIHDFHPRTLKIPDIACDHDKAIHHRCGGNQAIHIRQFLPRTHTTPNLNFIATNPKDSLFKNDGDLREIFFENRCFFEILFSNPVDSSTNLSKCKNAQIMGMCCMAFKPRTHSRIRSGTLPKFRNDVGIDQKHNDLSQSSTSPWSLRGGLALRGSFRSNIQSSASSAPSTVRRSNKFWLFDTLADFSAAAIASAKIRRCSSSAETPCAAARNFNAFTSASGIFLTSN